MRKAFNIVTGFLFGLSPLALALLFSALAYDAQPNVIGISISVILLIGASWLGIQVFKKVQIVGPLEFMSTVSASPDLDNLEPTENSEFKRRTSIELSDLFKTNKNLCKGGSIRIFGDWYGKTHDKYHQITKIEFDSSASLLIIYFDNNEKLKIWNPKNIFEADTYLKIISASKIIVELMNKTRGKNTNKSYHISYIKKDKKIKSESNIDWYKPNFDVSLGQPALMIYG